MMDGSGWSGLPESEAEREALAKVLLAEYGMLQSSLTATWSIIMNRASLFMVVLSSAVVALSLTANAAGFGTDFLVLALILLAVTLFIGLASYARVVQGAREAMVYVMGMNRIRHFLVDYAPAAAPFMVLSTHDDEAGLRRAQGTVQLGRPRSLLLTYGLPQTQGMLAVVVAVVGGAVGAVVVLLAGGGSLPALGVAAVVTVLLVAGLLRQWQAVVEEVRGGMTPLFPTPPDEGRAPRA